MDNPSPPSSSLQPDHPPVIVFGAFGPVRKDEVQFGTNTATIDIKGSLTRNIYGRIIAGAYKTRSLSSACIYKVPEELRKLNKSAYTPRLISIGPLHSDHYSPMQDIKLSYVNSLFWRMGQGNEFNTHSLNECVEEMKQSKEKAREFYAKEVDNLDEEMLLIDCCFILELLCRNNIDGNEKPQEETSQSNNSSSDPNRGGANIGFNFDPIIDNSLTSVTVKHDLLLLENQLPFFVLNKLFHLTMERIGDYAHAPKLALSDHVLSYFGDIMGCCTKSTCTEATKKSGAEDDYNHILHILHSHYLPEVQHPLEKVGSYGEFNSSATDLHYAGIKFVAADTAGGFFKVNFSEARGPLSWLQIRKPHFEISTLQIYDSTEPFLRNLIAYEQCCPGVLHHYFTSYAYLMDMLVSSAKDIELLEKAGVLRNYVGGNEDACTLFNKLCKEVVIGEFYFAKTCNNAAKYSKRCWPAAMAYLHRRYFENIWTTIAFFVGFVTFLITVIGFFRKRKLIYQVLQHLYVFMFF